MIEAILSGEVLKTISRAIVALVSECRIHFLNKGLHSRAVDPSNVAMVIVDVPKEAMESYRVDEEKVIGVDMNRIFEISKTISVKDLVEISVQDETNLRIKFGAVEYNLALIDPSAIRKEPKIPELNLPAKIVLDAKDFKKAISASEKVSENVILRSDKNSFTIEAKGDVERITFTMTGSELIEFNGGEARSMFSLDYLKEFCKIAGAGDLLTIHLGTNYPGRFSFELVGGKIRVEYILAPRVES
uniref:DNA polymerase sliding clamp n=1 Tax=Archaeoglobus fulgidus TaxID=2234 RepID=A0A7J2TL41_ARCFL